MKKEKQWFQTGYSNCAIDSERLADDLERSITELNSFGYEVVSVTPIASGSYRYDDEYEFERKYSVSLDGTNGHSYGGCSYTNSLIIVAKKMAQR